MKAHIWHMNGIFTRMEWRRSSHLVSILSVLLLVPSLRSSAQKAPELDYSIHLEPEFTGSRIKFVLEALLAHDPSCLIWPDAPTHRVVVRTSVPVDEAALQEWIAPSGLHVMSIRLILPEDPQERSRMIMAAAGFPVYMDTGHPEQDQNNYATAKAAWIDADPERYAELMRALNGEPAPTQVR
jgi:hypothetical protein